MADLSDIQAAGVTKVVGSDGTGVEQTPVQSTVGGGLHANLRNTAGTEVGTAAAPVRVDPTGTTTQPVSSTGNVASGATDSGNPVKIGGKYNSTLPTLTDGQRGDAQLDVNGRVKVDANLSSGQLVPTITNKLRIRYIIADVTLPATNAFQTIYSRSGTGLFFGTQLGFDNSSVTVRITIDGGQMFSLPLNDIKTFEFNDTTDGRIQMGGFITSVGNVFDFSSRYAIPYTASILIEASANDSSAHKLKRYMTIQTEDT